MGSLFIFVVVLSWCFGLSYGTKYYGTLNFYSSADCSVDAFVSNAYGVDNGTCTLFPSNPDIKSFKVVSLDDSCAATAYGDDVAYCSSDAKYLATLDTCYSNMTYGLFSIDCQDPSLTSVSPSILPATCTEDSCASTVAASSTSSATSGGNSPSSVATGASSTSSTVSGSSSTSSPSNSSLSSGAIAGIVVGCVIGGLLLLGIAFFFFWRHRKRRAQLPQASEIMSSEKNTPAELGSGVQASEIMPPDKDMAAELGGGAKATELGGQSVSEPQEMDATPASGQVHEPYKSEASNSQGDETSGDNKTK